MTHFRADAKGSVNWVLDIRYPSPGDSYSTTEILAGRLGTSSPIALSALMPGAFEVLNGDAAANGGNSSDGTQADASAAHAPLRFAQSMRMNA